MGDLDAVGAALQLVAPPDVGGSLTVVIGCAHEAGDTIPIPMGIQTDGKLIIGRKATVLGWSLVETTGSARAELRILDGADANGTLIADITLSPGESTRDLVPAPGVVARSGVYAKVVSGSVDGSLWVRVPGVAAEQWGDMR